jgi:hypothetical protein
LANLGFNVHETPIVNSAAEALRARSTAVSISSMPRGRQLHLTKRKVPSGLSN